MAAAVAARFKSGFCLLLAWHDAEMRHVAQVRLLLEQQQYDGALVDSLVIVGRVLGVLNIEKHVQALDLADQVFA